VKELRREAEWGETMSLGIENEFKIVPKRSRQATQCVPWACVKATFCACAEKWIEEVRQKKNDTDWEIISQRSNRNFSLKLFPQDVQPCFCLTKSKRIFQSE
jgi:hypothetical protein